MDDRIHPTSKIVTSNESWYRYLGISIKMRKESPQGNTAEQGRHLVSRTACGAKPEGFVMVTSEAKGETSPSYQGKVLYTVQLTLPPV